MQLGVYTSVTSYLYTWLLGDCLLLWLKGILWLFIDDHRTPPCTYGWNSGAALFTTATIDVEYLYSLDY